MLAYGAVGHRARQRRAPASAASARLAPSASSLAIAVAAAIFFTALIVRLLHVWQIRQAPFFSVLMGDARGYDEWARRIAAGDWIGSEVFYQAPLYPYFLGSDLRDCRPQPDGRPHLSRPSSGSAVVRAPRARRLAPVLARAGHRRRIRLALYAPAIFFDGLLQKSVLDVFFMCLALWIVSAMSRRS